VEGFNSKHNAAFAWTVFPVLQFSLCLPSDYRLCASSDCSFHVLSVRLPYLTLCIRGDNYLIIFVTETFFKLILIESGILFFLFRFYPDFKESNTSLP